MELTLDQSIAIAEARLKIAVAFENAEDIAFYKACLSAFNHQQAMEEINRRGNQ